MNEKKKSVSISEYIENKTTKIRLSPCVHITFCTVVTLRYLWMLTSYVTGGCYHISVVSECYGSPFIRLVTQSTLHSSFIGRICCIIGRGEPGEDEMIIDVMQLVGHKSYIHETGRHFLINIMPGNHNFSCNKITLNFRRCEQIRGRVKYMYSWYVISISCCWTKLLTTL